MVSVNSDNRLADILLEIKRHLRVCQGCAGAVKVRDRTMLCDHTLGLILTAVVQYDTVLKRRIRAKNRGGPVVYACPDMSAHGKSYALTAEPLQVTGVQEGLF